MKTCLLDGEMKTRRQLLILIGYQSLQAVDERVSKRVSIHDRCDAAVHELAQRNLLVRRWRARASQLVVIKDDLHRASVSEADESREIATHRNGDVFRSCRRGRDWHRDQALPPILKIFNRILEHALEFPDDSFDPRLVNSSNVHGGGHRRYARLRTILHEPIGPSALDAV
jgi:hypothetical protein